MRKTLVAFVLCVGCGGALAGPTMPPECYPGPLTCRAMGDYHWCADADGSKWLYGPAEWGYEHSTAEGCRICRVWGDAPNAWATGPTVDQAFHGCAQ